MELWVYDRSGPYSLGTFDIHDQPEKFIRALAGYSFMSDEELGMDTFLERGSEDLHVTIPKKIREDLRLQLVQKPLTDTQQAIVCRGTICYGSSDTNCVVKLSWTPVRNKSESVLLELARQRGVEGVAQLLAQHLIVSVKELRKDMIFGPHYKFRTTSLKKDSRSALSRSVPPDSLPQQPGLSSGASSSSKRKSVDEGFKPIKKSRSNSVPSKPEGTHGAILRPRNKEGHVIGASSSQTSLPSVEKSRLCEEQRASDKSDSQTRKRKSADEKSQPLKRSKSNVQHSDLQQGEGSQVMRVTSTKDDSFKNREFRCLAIAPAGRPLYKICSNLELVKALRDGLKAHKSLYLKGKILHRDISENNIILTHPNGPNDFTATLIDLDLAIEVNGERTGARQNTGTMEFMAIEILRGADHTYRHDIESFFYVLLWICGRRSWELPHFLDEFENRPIPSMLTKWYTGSFEDIAQSKEYAMSIGFMAVLKEFPVAFNAVKPLCHAIRDILFPLSQNDGLRTGTPEDPEELYGPILEAFDNAVRDGI